VLLWSVVRAFGNVLWLRSVLLWPVARVFGNVLVTKVRCYGVCLDVTLLIGTGREERDRVWVFLLVRTKGGRLGVLSSFLP
jgi:hypothetical protein